MAKFKKDVDFVIPKPGLCMMEGIEITFDDRSNQEGKGMLAIAKTKIVEHSVDATGNGAHCTDTFPLWTDFGFQRFGGLMLAMFPKKFDADKDYPMGYFNDTKIQKSIAKSFGGVQFGSNIKIDRQLKEGAAPGSKNDGDYLQFPKLGNVYDRDEYKDLLLKNKKGDKAAPAAATESGNAESGDNEADEW